MSGRLYIYYLFINNLIIISYLAYAKPEYEDNEKIIRYKINVNGNNFLLNNSIFI